MTRSAVQHDDECPIVIARAALALPACGELRAAVAVEREACARVAEQSRSQYVDLDGVSIDPGADIAALIRKRK